MVKAGVYLVARLSPILAGTQAWFVLMTGVGTATMLMGSYLAVQQADLKLILAYATVSVLGMLMMLFGIGTPLAIEAAIVYLLAHALYKSALFLVAGAVDHATGTRMHAELGGLRQMMPITAVAAALAALSMAGVPPWIGFISKEKLYEAALEAPYAATILIGAAVLTGIFFIVAAGLMSIQPFFGKKTDTPHPPHEVPFSMWLGPVVLAGVGGVIGWWPGLIETSLIAPAVAAVSGHPAHVKLALWHGLTPVFGLSLLTLGAGLGLYLGRVLLVWMHPPFAFIAQWGPAQWYDSTLSGLLRFAHLQTRLLQNGYLRYYVLTTIGVTLVLSGYTFASQASLPKLTGWTDVRFYEGGLIVLILLSAVVGVRSRSRLGVIAALSVVGYGVALVFIFFGAPDLAMTQFLIETLSVILFVLV
jgi:multicomponent Na+:H+ antiporter subunit A